MFSQVFICQQRGLWPGGRSGVSVRETPPYGKERVVCILLECILVFALFWKIAV